MGRVVAALVLSVALMHRDAGATDALPRRKATHSTAHVRSRLAEAQEQIHSVFAIYQSKGYGSAFPKGTYAHQVIAVKEPCFAFQIGAHGHDHLDWRDDPFQQWAYVTADWFYNVNPLNRTYSVRPIEGDDPLPQSMTSGFFFAATGIWPLDGRPPLQLRGRPYVLREVARCADYEVRPEQQWIDGHWCYCLEHAGRDRLWLDLDRGCALLVRELDDPENGALMQRYELRGHREIGPGIWLPTQVRTIQYDTTARTSEGRNRKIRDGIIEFSAIAVNKVDPDVFRYEPPPGALMLNSNGRSVQARPRGLDHLDGLVLWLRERRPLTAVATGGLLEYLAGLPSLLVIAFCEVSRRRSRRWRC